MAMVPYQDTVQLTPYEEGLQRLERRIEALEADSGAWFGEEQAKADTNAALHRLTEQLEVDVHRLDLAVQQSTRHRTAPQPHCRLRRHSPSTAGALDQPPSWLSYCYAYWTSDIQQYPAICRSICHAIMKMVK